ncbi:Retinoic acid induced 16-like protein [Geosmithia morbida]|uniref:Retinoic acid induced 16-like protein n=1 Tax=Geosmithia morbida TaxID=1094350 RepID=A0A9P5CZR2_9HYPO|nr:Retinoic acid induced 16-like protein [Geosmithia morbida]KAF4121878.1 Retinoic acid induced 16-like protein [Geosmithia morbida]
MDFATWRTSSNLSRDSDAAETLEIRLQELTNMLSDESRRPLPHPCIQFASIRQIYVPIGKIATTSYNEWIIKEAVLLFATLIESEEEAFVEKTTFSASLTNLLVRITGPNSVRLGLDTESRVVELAFNITTKIRLDPAILPAWFKATQRDAAGNSMRLVPGSTKPIGSSGSSSSSRDRFTGRAQRADFPLFYILMDYIHHEGKVGDFARTGLLYIIEAASSSTELEQWIVESDLSTLMATGLGALYSQLSRKLVIDHTPHNLPPILALSDYQHPSSNYEIISSCSPEFQSHIETFLSHLLFWQDVLNHCKSADVKSTLLEHFQVIFLQQLLYPSLLESSDIDGGSSVAVLTYLRRILEAVDHPDMINLILHYLLDLPDSTPSPPSKDVESRTSVSAARKRKSMDLATLTAARTDTSATPMLFNLVDLVLACLRSRNQQTIHVTLQLVSAILKRHHRYAVMTLLKTEILPGNTVRRTAGAHEQEVDYLMSLAGSVGGQDNFDQVYDGVLQDMLSRLESHSCSVKLVAPNVGKNNYKPPDTTSNGPLNKPRDVREHTLRPDDPLLHAMLDLLETFFLNAVETNLSVTESLVDLAICGYMSIEGWLSRSPSTYRYTNKDGREEIDARPEGGDDQEEAIRNCRRRPEWDQQSVPRFLDIIKHLCDQVANYKQSVPRFEELVQQRREAFHTADMILHNPMPPRRGGGGGGTGGGGGGGNGTWDSSPHTGNTPDQLMTPGEDTSRSASPLSARPSAFEGFAQRLLSELGTPSRSAIPRSGRGGGRDMAGRGAGSETVTPQPPQYIPRSASPSRLGEGILGMMDLDDPMSEHYDQTLTSRMADFAAVDQTILSRRSFVMELASLLQVRAGLFNEVRFV